MDYERIAKKIVASLAEKEVERLLKAFLKGTKFSNRVWSVGGYVRDQILGLDPDDLDLVTDIKGGSEDFTKFLKQKFPHELTTPIKMGTYPIWQVTFKYDIEYKGETYNTSSAVIEVAETMSEQFNDENSRQREVKYAPLEADVNRRDFTVNSLLRDMTSGELLDLTGQSVSDIKKGILRGNPGVDFDEILRQDPLRSIRLIRFLCKYDWSTPLSVLKSVKNNASRIQIISEERIRDELVKIMKLGKLAKAIKFFDSTGLLPYIFPEIEALKGIPQSKKHHSEGSVFRHSMMVMQNAKPGIENQLAALLHDTGKATTTEVIEGSIHSYGHEVVSGEIAEAVMRRLKFDLPTIRSVRTIVESHMKPHQLEGSGQTAIRRFIRDVGDELVDAVMDLAEADELGKLPQGFKTPALRERIEEVRRFQPPKKNKAVLDGNEIMKTLNIKPSAKVKEISNYLLEVEDEYSSDGKTLDKEKAKKLILEKYG